MRQDPGWLSELFAAIDRRDAPGFAGFLAEDARFRYGSQPPVEGREAIQQAVAAFVSGFRELRHELREVWQIPDRQTIFVEGQVTYTLPTGARISLPFLNRFLMRDELIVDYRIYADPTPLAASGDDTQAESPAG